ncbi:hypothetical protein VTO73DRAFT_11888 [Trametes versicolor]
MRLPITQLQPPPCRQSAAPARSLVPALILSAAPTPSIELVRLSTPAACTTTPPGLTRRSGVAQRQDARLSQSNLLLPPLTTPPRGPTSSRVHTPVWRALQTLLFCRPISSADRPVLISPHSDDAPSPYRWARSALSVHEGGKHAARRLFVNACLLTRSETVRTRHASHPVSSHARMAADVCPSPPSRRRQSGLDAENLTFGTARRGISDLRAPMPPI